MRLPPPRRSRRIATSPSRTRATSPLYDELTRLTLQKRASISAVARWLLRGPAARPRA